MKMLQGSSSSSSACATTSGSSSSAVGNGWFVSGITCFSLAPGGRVQCPRNGHSQDVVLRSGRPHPLCWTRPPRLPYVTRASWCRTLCCRRRRRESPRHRPRGRRPRGLLPLPRASGHALWTFRSLRLHGGAVGAAVDDAGNLLVTGLVGDDLGDFFHFLGRLVVRCGHSDHSGFMVSQWVLPSTMQGISSPPASCATTSGASSISGWASSCGSGMDNSSRRWFGVAPPPMTTTVFARGMVPVYQRVVGGKFACARLVRRRAPRISCAAKAWARTRSEDPDLRPGQDRLVESCQHRTRRPPELSCEQLTERFELRECLGRPPRTVEREQLAAPQAFSERVAAGQAVDAFDDLHMVAEVDHGLGPVLVGVEVLVPEALCLSCDCGY